MEARGNTASSACRGRSRHARGRYIARGAADGSSAGYRADGHAGLVPCGECGRGAPPAVELRRGPPGCTRHFAPGAKVYCTPIYHYWSDSLVVIVRHRGSHRYATMVVRRQWLADVRIELVYSPHVVREMRRVVLAGLPDDATEYRRRLEAIPWNGTPEGRQRAQEYVAAIRARDEHSDHRPGE